MLFERPPFCLLAQAAPHVSRTCLSHMTLVFVPVISAAVSAFQVLPNIAFKREREGENRSPSWICSNRAWTLRRGERARPLLRARRPCARGPPFSNVSLVIQRTNLIILLLCFFIIIFSLSSAPLPPHFHFEFAACFGLH